MNHRKVYITNVVHYIRNTQLVLRVSQFSIALALSFLAPVKQATINTIRK